jgi:LacI family transcriptional regulator
MGDKNGCWQRQQEESSVVTLRDVARRAGVSIPTVSRVLAGKADSIRIGKACQERVRRAADRLGFYPNAAARTVRTGRFGSVALLMPRETAWGPLMPQLLEGLRDGLEEFDSHLLIARLPDRKLTDADYVPRILRELTADGLLINYVTNTPPDLATLIRRYRLPSVWINVKRSFDCVYPDDYAGGRRAVQHLLDLGHRRLGWIDYHFDGVHAAHYSVKDRLSGGKGAARAAGARLRFYGATVPNQSLPREQRLAATKHWLSSSDRPTGIVAYSSRYAATVLLAAVQMGLRVPDDLAIVGFDEVPCSEHGLPFATVVIPTYEMGQAAVRLLMAKMAHPRRVFPAIAIPHGFAPGALCGPPSAAGH